MVNLSSIGGCGVIIQHYSPHVALLWSIYHHLGALTTIFDQHCPHSRKLFYHNTKYTHYRFLHYMALTKLATQSVLAVPLMCMKLARIQNFKIRLFGVFDKKNGGQFWGGDYSHLSWHNFPHIPYVIFVTNIRYELPHWNKKTHDKKKYIYYYLRASWINISEEWLKLLVFASHILSGWPKNICLGYPITFPWQKNFVLKLLAFPSHSSNILVGWRLRWLRKKLQKKLN